MLKIKYYQATVFKKRPFFFFCILLVFIGLSYLQELLQTKRLYTTSYIGVSYLQRNKLLEKTINY